jgi:hypothetical protein
MDKKLLITVSAVLLSALAGRTSGQCECPILWPGDIIITDTVVCEEGFYIEGCRLIVESTGTLIANDDSGLGWGQIIVNGGSVIVNGEFKMGSGGSSYLGIYDGGTFIQQNDTAGIEFPDDVGGEHRIYVNNGTLQAYKIDFRGERDAHMYLGCKPYRDGDGAMVILESAAPGSSLNDPQKWYDDGYLHCSDICTETVVEYVDGGAVVYCKYVSDVPECSWAPYPYDDQNDASPNSVLIWMPGDLAASHDVYFGTSWNEVDDANRSYHPNVDYNNVTETTYDPGPLELGHTYYWRVDEVNEPDTWKCRIWSFKTADYVVIDDMEIYTPGFESEYPITQQTGSYGWDCGYTNVSGSQLDLQTEGPVRDYQSMLYYYDNSVNWGDGCYCVISNHFVLDPCDWTSFGVKILSLWFYGDPDNDADETEQMYVALEDTNGAYAEVRYPLEDMNDIRLSEWQRWDIALSSFNDVNLFSVKDLYIGFGQMSSLIPGGDGIVHFDDIRLYPPMCVPQYRPAADFSGNCTVNFEDYAILANQWFRPPGDPSADVAPEPPDGIVNWRDLAVLADEWLQQKLWP